MYIDNKHYLRDRCPLLSYHVNYIATIIFTSELGYTYVYRYMDEP